MPDEPGKQKGPFEGGVPNVDQNVLRPSETLPLMMVALRLAVRQLLPFGEHRIEVVEIVFLVLGLRIVVDERGEPNARPLVFQRFGVVVALDVERVDGILLPPYPPLNHRTSSNSRPRFAGPDDGLPLLPMDGGLVGVSFIKLIHPFSERHHPRIRDSDSGVPPSPIPEVGLDVLHAEIVKNLIGHMLVE